MAPEDSRSLAANIAFCETVGIVPRYLTRDAFDGWYDSLEKPPATPPGWVFGPAWTTLYLLMGVARYLVSEEDASTGLFDLQLALNDSGMTFNNSIAQRVCYSLVLSSMGWSRSSRLSLRSLVL